jgi:hypothetical protein
VVERDQEIDGAGAVGHREVTHPRPHQLAGAGALVALVDGSQIGLEVIGQFLGVAEPRRSGPNLGPILDEEVEWVDHLEVGDEPDGDAQPAHRLREDQSC